MLRKVSWRRRLSANRILHRADQLGKCSAEHADVSVSVLRHPDNWIATWNDIQLGSGMPRRCYWIHLDAKDSQPCRRTGFQHPNLRDWVKEHRGETGRKSTVLEYHPHMTRTC